MATRTVAADGFTLVHRSSPFWERFCCSSLEDFYETASRRGGFGGLTPATVSSREDWSISTAPRLWRHRSGGSAIRPGTPDDQAAEWTGLPAGIPVAVGDVDAHVAAAAGNAVAPGQMVAIMGNSTCHVMNGDSLREVPGMRGVVDGGIVAGRWGYEAGQSGTGDILGWFATNGVPDEYRDRAVAAGQSVHRLLTELAAPQPIGAHGLMALDWHSGYRSTLVDHELSGLILGLTLTTRPEDIYRALIEATAYGTRTIIDAFNSWVVPVRELVITGGLVKTPC